ncbi:MAG: Tol biopolymer transport system component [Cellvibrionaceae bacterium]|jgi:Tol biopolymer transport system component
MAMSINSGLKRSLKRLSTALVAVGIFLIFSACNLLPALRDEADNTSSSSANDRLEESDFAILIGRKSGLITYLGPNGNVFTTNQAGRNLVSITSDSNLDKIQDLNRAPEAVYYLLPTWSTSGRKLAFGQHHVTNSSDQDFAQAPDNNLQNQPQSISISNEQNQLEISEPTAGTIQQQDRDSQTNVYTIFSADADGANKKIVWRGTARPIYMYWAPDEVTLSVLLQEPGANALQLVLISTTEPYAGNEAIQVIDVGGPLYWDWAPHGKQILTHVGTTAPSERMSLLNLEASVVEEVLDFSPARFAAPDISPDGRRIMLPLRSDIVGDDDTWVSIISMATRKKSTIDKINGDLFIGGAFSPDSSKVGYIASKANAETPVGELAVYTLETGELAISESKNLIAFFWSPDSSKIALFELIPSTTGEDNEQSTNGRPKLGLYIFDVESEEVVELIKPFETTAQFTEVLTFYSQYQRSATIWSPDSQSVVLPVRTPGGPVIIVMDISGKIHPRTLAPGVLAFWSAE